METINYRSTSRRWTGLLLILAGLLLFAYKMGAPVPGWLFRWRCAFIVVGLVIGIRNRFRNNIWIIFTMIGALNLVSQLRPDLNFDAFVAPIVIILIGLIFILRPSKGWRRGQVSMQSIRNEWQEHVENPGE